MNSKFKGSLAVAQSIGKLYSLGYEVLLPVGDRRPYDLVFDNGEGLFKVQVKYSSLNKKERYSAFLRVMGGNRSFNYARKYGDDDFDYLYVFTALGKHYMIPWNELKNRNQINVDLQKYQKYLL